MSEGKTIRAFVAVPVSREVCEAVSRLQDTLRRRGISLRWVRPEGLHFTLKFLGNIDEGIVEPLGEKLREIASEHPIFELRIGGIGAFPNLNAPRVLWAGVESGAELLTALARQVSEVVREFPTEADSKKFKPHLTLARSKDRRSRRLVLPEKLTRATLEATLCDRVVLMKSELSPKGAKHTCIVTAELASKIPDCRLLNDEFQQKPGDVP